MPTDPYTQVYNAIWTTLEASTEFCDLVKAGNRIKFCGGPPTIKSEVQAGDLPEVEVVPAEDANYEYGGSSSSVTDTMLFRINAFTGTLRLDETGRGLFLVKWAIFRALRLAPKLGVGFVEDARIVSSAPTPKTPRGNGWGMSWTLKVVLRFKRDGATIFA